MNTTITFSVFDWIILFVYLGFVVGIGYYLKKFTKTGDDFFLAGRRNSMWVCGVAFMSANMGAIEVIGYAGQSIKYGLYAAHFYLIGAVPAMLFLGVVMMPFYYNSKIKTIPGFLNARFNKQTRLLNAILFAINMILVSGIALYLLALVMHIFLGWNWDLSIWLAVLLVGFYITMSGLLSAMFTEVIQFFLIWASILLLPLFGLIDIGGTAQLGTHLSNAMSTLWSTSANPANNAMHVTWAGLILGLGFAIGFGYWTTDFLIIQRAFSAKDLRSARMTPIIGSYFKLLLGAVVVCTGLIAYVLIHDPTSGFHLLSSGGQVNYDSVIPLLIKRYFPSGLIGIGVTAMVAMFMAGTSGNMSAFNTVWTHDIYQTVINKNATDAQLLRMGRIATIVGLLLAGLGAYVAKSMPTVIGYLQVLSSVFLAPTFAVIILGIVSKKISPKGAFWGLLIGMIFAAFTFILQDIGVITTNALVPLEGNEVQASFMAANFWRAFWAWVASAVGAVVISLVTEKKPQAAIEGYVVGTVTKHRTSERHLPWYQKTVFWALITTLIFIFINIYFW